METNSSNDIGSLSNDNTEVQTKGKFLKNIAFVLFSNILSIVSGTLVGFIIPKIMGITDYGYYKTVILYSSYIGLFHFGFIDGIYLYFAGRKYESLDKQKFRTYTRFLFIMEISITLIVLCISFCFFGTENCLIFLLVALNILALNMTTYYEFITQITMRFKQLSIRSIIKCLATIISIIVLYSLYKSNGYKVEYVLYSCIVIGINYFLAGWYIFSYRKITFGHANTIKNEIINIKKFFNVGFPLLLANLIGQFIFTIDQQFVNILFDKRTYGIYAFSYSLISLVSIATGAISTVLYPTLRLLNKETIKDKYSILNTLLIVFVGLCLFAFYPLSLLINYFLPEYKESLIIFGIIFPGVVISSSISVIKYNCYKSFGLIKNYFYKSLFVLILSIIANIIVYLIFKSTSSISIASIFVLIVWYLLVENYFIRKYRVAWIKNFLYIIFIISGFYIINLIDSLLISGALFLLLWLVLTFCFFFKNLKNLRSNHLK